MGPSAEINRDEPLQRFADTDFADHIVGFAMQFLQRGPGFFLGAVFQLREFEAAFAVELVLDDVFGRLGHGFTFLEGAMLSSVSSWNAG